MNDPSDFERRRKIGRHISRFLHAMAAVWLLLFVAAMMTEQRWFWTVVGAVAGACALYALLAQRGAPDIFAGVWTGIGVGLLQAGWCYGLFES